MGFGIGVNGGKPREKAVGGRYQKVAVGCWFTASGRSIPQLVKYEDETGSLHMLRDIRIMTTEKKYFGGILSQKYVCHTVVDGRQYEFILLYYPESNEWDMVLK